MINVLRLRMKVRVRGWEGGSTTFLVWFGCRPPFASKIGVAFKVKHKHLVSVSDSLTCFFAVLPVFVLPVFVLPGSEAKGLGGKVSGVMADGSNMIDDNDNNLQAHPCLPLPSLPNRTEQNRKSPFR